MLRTTLAVLATGALAIPGIALAQQSISVGQTVNGTLAADDPTLGDDSHYDLYTFHARAGQRYAVRLHSEAFDAYLAVAKGAEGAGPGCDEESGCEVDDDGGSGTDARVVFTAEEDGVYSIRANSFEGDETGDYTLSLTEATAAVADREIRLDQEINSELDESDPEADDDSYYEEWSFRPDFTGRVVISMGSDDFDTYLKFGTGTGEDFDESETNDDAGDESTDSELTVSVVAGQVYTIQANALSAGETGDYTLSVRRDRNN
jgi:hypothetical protein